MPVVKTDDGLSFLNKGGAFTSSQILGNIPLNMEYTQIVGVSIGTNSVPFVADLLCVFS